MPPSDTPTLLVDDPSDVQEATRPESEGCRALTADDGRHPTRSLGDGLRPCPILLDPSARKEKLANLQEAVAMPCLRGHA